MNRAGSSLPGAALRQRIRAHGSIGVDEFMRVALQDPEHGYYRRKAPIGRRGDFVTAPEISQMFGELVAMWLADLWLRASRPAAVRLVELGPGRGTLMADLLRAAATVPGFRAALHPVLVETGEALRAEQRRLLAGSDAVWVDSVDSALRSAAGPTFWLANEFFDALPIRQGVRGRNGWRQRRVGLDAAGGFAWASPGPPVRPPAPLARVLAGAAEGAVVEWCPEGVRGFRRIAGRIARQGGAALVIDYGYLEGELAAAGGGDTLQAVRAHAFAPVLEAVGEADLSAQVNFSALARAGREAGARVLPVTPQGRFLRRLGIEGRAAALARGRAPAARAAIAAALHRLTDADAMGASFRVLALHAPDWPVPAGLDAPGCPAREDRSCNL